MKGSKTSCYIGTFTGDFEELQVRDNEGPSMYHATGLSSSLASNRLSWFYDLKGPSMTIDTACSSSLTAFHLACQSLRTGEATMVSDFYRASLGLGLHPLTYYVERGRRCKSHVRS